MPSCELKDCDEQSKSPDDVTAPKNGEHSMEQGPKEKGGKHANLGGHGNQVENEDEEEDEEEDVDFNPFLKETPSREASSSLSSEIEGLDADFVDAGGYASVALAKESKGKPSNPLQDYPVGDTDCGEKIGTQTATSSVEECKKDFENEVPHENGDGSGELMNANNDLVAGEFDILSHSKKLVMSMDSEDAICMRTRARYSLASFTLDELETFLQETDDEDDLQNIDDEAEYRKFLAAVLQGGDGDTQGLQENENADDEDEENDADFELELEEALESENDEDARYEIQEESYEAAGHRPNTRRNRRQKVSVGGNRKLLGHRSLCPVFPCVPIMQRPAFPTLDGTNIMCNPSSDFLPSIRDGSVAGFTPHQIGQLHCLIHEHVQLLIQVFSVCVLEPSRRHIASKVQELLSEMLHTRENVLAWQRQRLPYPGFCFFPPCIHPSVPNEASFEHSSWMPYINGPVLSIMDVAPLRLVGNFVDEVSVVVQEYHRQQVGLMCDTLPEKEPLFPLNNSPGATGPCDQALRDAACPSSTSAHFSSDNDQAPKRTMASTLVERAKKQSVALVPKEIAQLAWRFYSLFNPALYPHKPPPTSVANRVLFTDAEDELLALGLMEYNTDWRAIQQRFLPCKSKHQIFVRQKNRSSSKAPENPIKAVRRMKTSPLTTEEISRIHEGLKVYKLDWMSIWKFIVPYRDPSLLPRQWRIAIGTQKSYKLDATKKAKRQQYDLRRKSRKSANLVGWHSSPEKDDNRADKAVEENSNADIQIEKEDEAYVHEAFLADWRPGASKVSSTCPDSERQEKSPPIQAPSREGSQVREQLDSSGSGDTQPLILNSFPAAVRPAKTPLRWRPYRARRVNSARVVKLAPDLPPVNLPPSVRVMSQSAFKSYQTRATMQICNAGTSVVGPEAGNGVLECTANSRANYPVKAAPVTKIPVNPSSHSQQPQDSVITRKGLVAERKGESDLQMHPLLFQTPEDGHFPYYPLHSGASSSSSFKFFARSPPQLNLSLFHNAQHTRSAVNFLGKPSKPKEGMSYQTGFHPLLQRSEDTNSSLVAAYSTIQLSSNQEISEGRCARDQNSLHATDKMSNVNVSSAAACLRPVSPSEKSGELDLDIHLSFTSRLPKDVGSRESNECSGAISAASAVDSSGLKSHKARNSLMSYHYMAPVPDRNGSEFDSNGPLMVVSSDEGIRKSADDVEDQSLPDIVMEQEELSDSEDEIGENVEFECEEMADSEGEEESEFEQMVVMQNEEVEEADMDTDFADQLPEPARFDDSESNALGTNECRMMDTESNALGTKERGMMDTESNALGTKERGMMDTKVDNSSSSFHLNLNSCPPGSPFVDPNNEGIKGTSSCLDAKVHSVFNKASKNISGIDDHSKLQRQVANLASQSNPKSGVSSSKQSRKRASGTQPGLSRSTSKKRNTRLSSDSNSEKLKHPGQGEVGEL